MNPLNLPVFTINAQCQDCYKCVRQCPVKAIKVEDGHASIIPELCIHCGHCVAVCPVHAKQIRDDLSKFKVLTAMNKKIIISLAPSWRAEFKNIPDSKMIAAIKKLGVEIVSETALGAEEVNANIAKFLSKSHGIKISSACPSIVELIEKYYPHLVKCITPIASPLLSHTKYLRNLYGDEYIIGFIGPCISKKVESDQHPNELNFAVTFNDLQELFAEKNIVPNNLPDSNDKFEPDNAKEGNIYPIDGGMIQTIDLPENCKYELYNISDVEKIKELFSSLTEKELKKDMFFETLACKGGCVNGPGCVKDKSYLLKEIDILSDFAFKGKKTDRDINNDIDISLEYSVDHKLKRDKNKTLTIEEVFKSIGKHKPEDEKNCGGCGYNSCRDFAEAIIEGKAEPSMCVSYLRKLAQKKTTALFKTIPSGIIIVNKNMEIQETNINFFKILGLTEFFGTDAEGYEGARLDKMISFTGMFKKVLDGGEDINEKEINVDDKYLKITIFTVEPNELVGAVLQDITEPSVMRDHTINQAKKVIEKNLDMVQKVAFLLGENAAAAEVALNSIIELSGKSEKMSK